MKTQTVAAGPPQLLLLQVYQDATLAGSVGFMFHSGVGQTEKERDGDKHETMLDQYG